MKSKYFSLHNRLILIVFSLTFVTGWFCARQSLKTTQNVLTESICDGALNEQFRIGHAIKRMAEGHNYSREDERYYLPGALSSSALSYAEYYGADASFRTFRIMSDEIGTVYSNIPDEYILLLGISPKADGTVSYVIKQAGDKTLILVSSYIKIYHSLFRLDYVQDITSLNILVASLANRIALTLFSVELLLLPVLFFIIRGTLLPLNNLNEQAVAITAGNYGLRAKIVYNDEVGQLAANFNDMADAVQNHIHTISESARLKELFASNLAHEIKTPITSIVAYSDYAARADVKDKELHDILEYIRREGQRIGELSDKILKWSSIEHGGKADIKPCRPQRIIDRVLYTLCPPDKSKRREIQVENRCDILYADEALITSLLVNLCKNALNASAEGAPIEMKISNDRDGSLRIIIRDTGIGIEGGELAHITEPFYMVDKSRDRGKGGAGLGLPLCQAIVEAHSGKMKIESKLGQGTCVTVTIPQQYKLTT